MIQPRYYEFCCRVRTISGTRALEKIPGLLAGMNAKKPMIITDKGIVAAGLVAVLKKAMGSGVKIGAMYDNVPVDSDYRLVNDAAGIYRKKGCDSIIAVGGGSAMDTAKGVNTLASLGGNNLRDYEGANNITQKLNPMIAIPTTSGTGSEMTFAMVVADPDRHVKMAFLSNFLLPDVAVLDPRMTRTLPAAITAATAMDALTHAMEAYFCMGKNILSDSFALPAIRGISENLLHVIKTPGDMKGRLALANASAMAGASFSNSMTGMVHNLGHAIGGVCRPLHTPLVARP